MKVSKIKLQQVVEKEFNYDGKITSPKDAVELVNKNEEINKATEEILLIICLNAKNQIVAYSEIAKGGIDYCNVDIKTIFKTILLCNANQFILVHNHPSGNAEISVIDRNLTTKVKKAAETMNIRFLDHIVVGRDNFKSYMREEWKKEKRCKNVNS